MKRFVLPVVFALLSLVGLVACGSQSVTSSDIAETTTETISEVTITDQSETTTEVVTDEATTTEVVAVSEAQPEQAVQETQTSNLQFVVAYADW